MVNEIKNKRLTKIATASLIIFSSLLILSIFFLYIMQDNIIFRRPTMDEEKFNRIKERYSKCDAIEIKGHDNCSLYGWYLNQCREDGKKPLLIHFGGNANLSSNILRYIQDCDNYAVLSVDYRGFGKSEGKPSEKKIFEDALHLYDTFAAKEEIDENNIFIMGYSLGTGVSTYVASNRPVRGVILSAPFDSITNLVKGKIPILPIHRLVKHPFDSLSRAKDIKAPLLVFIAENDQVIPHENTMNLVNTWGGEYTIEYMEGKDHGSLWRNTYYWDRVDSFIEQNIK